MGTKKGKRIIKKTRGALTAAWRSLSGLFVRTAGYLKKQAFITKMKKADIIFASPRTRRLPPIALTYRFVLRAHYIHSMLYIGEGKVLHTTSRHGVVIDDVPKKIYKKEKYAVFRLENLSTKQQEGIIQSAMQWKGKKLDYVGIYGNVFRKFFRFKKKRQASEKRRTWCSKMIYSSYASQGIDLLPAKKHKAVTSDDLTRSPLLTKL